MSSLVWIILSTFLISLLGWIGILVLFLKEELIDKILLILVALAAGGLIGGAFLHLLPQAINRSQQSPVTLFIYSIIGFCLFYILEQFIHWHHHHGTTHKHEPVSYLVLISDTIHNFIDGLIIAGSFLISLHLGLVTSVVIALHEIPQEIGDFGVLIYGGFSKRNSLILNYITQTTVILGGITGFLISGLIENIPIFLLPFAAGNFIYIASSDLIPEIKHTEKTKNAIIYFLVFIIGILLMYSIKIIRINII